MESRWVYSHPNDGSEPEREAIWAQLAAIVPQLPSEPCLNPLASPDFRFSIKQELQVESRHNLAPQTEIKQ